MIHLKFTIEQLMKALLIVVLFIYTGIVSAVPSFPGCQGGGCASLGGRGGTVVEVTNLNDSGAGSLRNCTDVITTPRICVFKVGGTITLSTPLNITSPKLTVAGQTAPGGGILLRIPNGNIVQFAAADIVWRFMRHRKGYGVDCANGTTTDCGATFTFWSRSQNVVVDHSSTSWNQDEGISLWHSTTTSPAVQNFTLSWNLIAEGLGGGVNGHSTGVLMGGAAGATGVELTTNLDMHHSLIMTDSHRNPLMKNKSTRLVNNLFYNQLFYENQFGGGIVIDIINNHYKQGPLNRSDAHTNHEIQGFGATAPDLAAGVPSAYVIGNTGWHQANPAGDQWLMASQVNGENGQDTSDLPFPTAWKRGTPMANTTYPIVAQTAAAMEPDVVADAGASRKLNCNGTWTANRDAVDTRLANEYNTDTGHYPLVENETDVGGYPTIVNGTPCADTDHDGMPDVWESANHLNPNLASDGATIIGSGPNAGYSNLDIYLAGR